MWPKRFTIFLLIGFGCIAANGASDSFIHLNSYGWTISTNSALHNTYSDIITPKFAWNDAPPPPSYAEQAMNRQASHERQERYRKRVPIPGAVNDSVRTAYLADQAASKLALMPKAAAPIGHWLQFFLYLAVFFLVGLLLVGRLAPDLLAVVLNRHNPWAPKEVQVRAYSAKVRAEEDAFARFVSNFKVGPARSDASGGFGVEQSAVRQFIGRTSVLLHTQRQIFEDIDRAWNDSARHRMLASLRREMSALKEEANFPEVLVIWQVASAMEGFLKQLIDRAGNVNPSTLRTIRGGVDLLADLCVPGFKPDLLTERPLRFLAVDDDLISRQALSVALKKALNQPDLALDGQGATVYSARNSYDVIFLDVQMPDVDGFELCTKIHETEANRSTPVVFVTGQSDFNARAQSTLSGGTDLMAKPFLTFEVTVKALTLALRGRLQEGTHTNGHVKAPAKTPLQQPEEALSTTDTVPDEHEADTDVAPHVLPPADKPIIQFLALAKKHLPSLKKICGEIGGLSDEKKRQDKIADAFLGIHSIIPDVTLALHHPAFQVGVALEGLLRKLLADQKNTSAYAIAAIVTAVDLLDDLCAPGMTTDLTAEPIEILVVDDDAFSRRALTGALQLTFEKPEAVESGEAAVAVATEKTFDVIFMDVVMPGMDGFAACAKIRESKLNGSTPIVFVTGQSGFAAREQMARQGSDLMGKPFLTAEVTIKALTFALQNRLRKSKIAAAQQP